MLFVTILHSCALWRENALEIDYYNAYISSFWADFIIFAQ